jgi:hypothetical protein
MQALSINPIVIERVLNHIEPNKLRRTYQTFDYSETKKDAWHKLGKLLSELTTQQTETINGTSNAVI